MSQAIKNIAKDIIINHLEKATTVGLGSGSTVSLILREISNINCEHIEFIPSSLQIKIEAETQGLRLATEEKIPFIDLVFDGADQINSDLFMVKGGGGALLREKILMRSSKKNIIIADSNKFVNKFTHPVPIEVHYFARSSFINSILELGGNPVLRTIKKGYPYITENGNLIFDTSFESFHNIKNMEQQLKLIPGVIEVGLFTHIADIYYKLDQDEYSIITK